MAGLSYVLRTFPELSETFVLREIQALRAAGVPVQVLALAPGRRPDLALAGAEGLPEVVYLAGKRRPGAPPAERRRPRSAGPLLRRLAGDIVRLRGHPRRSARAARLAVWAWRGARLVERDSVRLHAHFANDAAALARYLGAAAGLPYTVTAHAWDIYQDPFLLEPNLAGARRVFTVARANVEHLRAGARAGGRDPEAIRLLRCGLDLSRLAFRPPGAVRRPARLVCIARLVAKKGHEALLAAVSHLHAAGHPVRLELIGEGPEEEALRRLAAERGLAGSLRFCGALDNAAALQRLAGADLCVLAARVAADGDRDGLPVALIEAAALGVPICATAVAGIPDLLDETTGWPVEPGDPGALADHLAVALAAPADERRARAARARARVEEEFDLAAQVAALTAADLQAPEAR